MSIQNGEKIYPNIIYNVINWLIAWSVTIIKHIDTMGKKDKTEENISLYIYCNHQMKDNIIVSNIIQVFLLEHNWFYDAK